MTTPESKKLNPNPRDLADNLQKVIYDNIDNFKDIDLTEEQKESFIVKSKSNQSRHLTQGVVNKGVAFFEYIIPAEEVKKLIKSKNPDLTDVVRINRIVGAFYQNIATSYLLAIEYDKKKFNEFFNLTHTDQPFMFDADFLKKFVKFGLDYSVSTYTKYNFTGIDRVTGTSSNGVKSRLPLLNTDVFRHTNVANQFLRDMRIERYAREIYEGYDDFKDNAKQLAHDFVANTDAYDLTNIKTTLTVNQEKAIVARLIEKSPLVTTSRQERIISDFLKSRPEFDGDAPAEASKLLKFISENKLHKANLATSSNTNNQSIRSSLTRIGGLNTEKKTLERIAYDMIFRRKRHLDIIEKELAANYPSDEERKEKAKEVYESILNDTYDNFNLYTSKNTSDDKVSHGVRRIFGLSGSKALNINTEEKTLQRLTQKHISKEQRHLDIIKAEIKGIYARRKMDVNDDYVESRAKEILEAINADSYDKSNLETSYNNKTDESNPLSVKRFFKFVANGFGRLNTETRTLSRLTHKYMSVEKYALENGNNCSVLDSSRRKEYLESVSEDIEADEWGYNLLKRKLIDRRHKSAINDGYSRFTFSARGLNVFRPTSTEVKKAREFAQKKLNEPSANMYHFKDGNREEQIAYQPDSPLLMLSGSFGQMPRSESPKNRPRSCSMDSCVPTQPVSATSTTSGGVVADENNFGSPKNVSNNTEAGATSKNTFRISTSKR